MSKPFWNAKKMKAVLKKPITVVGPNYVPSCGCRVPAWEDCIHTERQAEDAKNSMTNEATSDDFAWT
jgi:hypothetical protein